MLRIKQLTLVLGDLVCLYLGLYIAILIRHLKSPAEQTLTKLLSPMSWLFIFAIVVMFIAGNYDPNRIKPNWSFYKRNFLIAFIWILIGIVFFYINPKTVSPKTILVLTAFCSFILITIWRIFYNKFLSTSILNTKIIFLGLTPESLEVAELLTKEKERGYEINAIVDPENPNFTDGDLISDKLNTSIELKIETNLEKKLNKFKNNENILVVVAPQLLKNKEILKILYQKMFLNINVVDLTSFYEEVMGRIPPFIFSEDWFLSNFQEQTKKMYDRFKILIDYFFGILTGIFFIILFLPTALAIKLNSKGPVFFTQTRATRRGKKMKIYKFRTMKALNSDGSAETHGPEFAKEDDERITGVGKFLRKTRIDELPQFINILKGEMSFIGPRPERPEFIEELIEDMPFYKLRLLVKPGLTGWAQIQHGYAGSRDENLRKLEYDLYYIKNRGPLLDLAILLRTVNIVLRMGGR